MVVVVEKTHLSRPLDFFFFAEVFLMEDKGGRCGSGGVGAFIRRRAWSRRGRRHVVPVAAREYGTSNRGEARIELTAFGLYLR